MNRFAVGYFNGVFHTFADRGVGVNTIEYFVMRGFQFTTYHCFNNYFGHIIADHMCVPSHSPYFASKITLTKPSVWPAAEALPEALNGNLPTLIS